MKYVVLETNHSAPIKLEEQFRQNQGSKTRNWDLQPTGDRHDSVGPKAHHSSFDDDQLM